MIAKDIPLVSIAIPTYNRADGYLKQAIASAVNQTYQNIEIIVADNCSNDHTENVVRGFPDSRLHYFRHEKNIGANNNFNFCVEQAKGHYFLLLHDDDLIDSDFAATSMNAADYATDVGIIRTGTRVIDAQGNVLHEYPNMAGGLSTEDFFRGWFASRTSLYLCSTLFNTERLKAIGGFQSPKNLFQDDIAIVQLAAKFGRVDTQHVKASFRRHPGEMTAATKVNDWCEDSLTLLKVMCELVPQESKKMIRDEGMRFFCRINYSRARMVQLPLSRLAAYFRVFKRFHYRYLPPCDHFLSPVYRLFYGTRMYYGLRFVKRKIERLLSHG